ncbi:hypothetical protein ABFA07_015321 [Porites harrisoni]
MIKVVVSKAVIKGYHIFQIRPSPLLDLQVTKEYGNKHDKYACLIWVPELELIPRNMWSIVTDAKRGERVETIAGLPIRRVPQGLSSCLWELLSFPHVASIDCKQAGHPCQSFSPWPVPQSPGGGAVIPCSFIINVKDDQQLVVLERVQSAVNNMAERSVLKITII